MSIAFGCLVRGKNIFEIENIPGPAAVPARR